MAYTKQTWQNEVLSGVSADQALFTIKNSSGTIINDDVIIELKSTEVQAGSEFTADRMNHIEDGIEANSAAFDASTGHDHNGTNSKKIAYANVTDTPAFETSASNIKPDGTASAGSSGKIADAAHIHPEIRLLNNGGAHNSIWRGISLGTSVTTAQWTAISNGTFENLYIGDYWTISDIVWRIWHFNYYYNVGDTNCTTNHVTIVPDTSLYTAKMNDTSIVTGAYAGSKMRTTNLDSAKTTINNAFGSSHILNHRVQLANAVAGATVTGWSWYDSTVELMTERQVYGARAWGVYDSNSTGYETASQSGRFMAPSLNHNIVHIRTTYWLQNIASTEKFVVIADSGRANLTLAANNYGVRPYFQIIG